MNMWANIAKTAVQKGGAAFQTYQAGKAVQSGTKTALAPAKKPAAKPVVKKPAPKPAPKSVAKPVKQVAPAPQPLVDTYTIFGKQVSKGKANFIGGLSLFAAACYFGYKRG